jgi:predicted MPP superfamily phosphohydrolase
MPGIKRIFLNDKQQPEYTDRFFQNLKSIFTNLRILEIGSNFHLIDNNSLNYDAQLSTVHTLIIVNNQDHRNVHCLFKLLPNLYRLVIDYDLLVASMERQEQLQEILIHFQPNQHIDLDEDFKMKLKVIYRKAKILF